MSCIVLVVVTIDGILLTKSGTMTGGTSSSIEVRSHKWDDKKVDGMCNGVYLNNSALVAKCLIFASLRTEEEKGST